MLCLLVSILKEKPVNDNFNSWDSVVSFVNGNVTKFTQEVLSLQKKLLESTYTHNYDKLQYLYNEYFSHCKIQAFKNHIANKHLRIIAHFVYTVLCYILGKEEDHFNDDLSQINNENTFNESATTKTFEESLTHNSNNNVGERKVAKTD